MAPPTQNGRAQSARIFSYVYINSQIWGCQIVFEKKICTPAWPGRELVVISLVVLIAVLAVVLWTVICAVICVVACTVGKITGSVLGLVCAVLEFLVLFFVLIVIVFRHFKFLLIQIGYAVSMSEIRISILQNAGNMSK